MLGDIQFRIFYLPDCYTEATERSSNGGGDDGSRGFLLSVCCYIHLWHPLQAKVLVASEAVITNVRVKRKTAQLERNVGKTLKRQEQK
jgi:hypothetical protein